MGGFKVGHAKGPFVILREPTPEDIAHDNAFNNNDGDDDDGAWADEITEPVEPLGGRPCSPPSPSEYVEDLPTTCTAELPSETLTAALEFLAAIGTALAASRCDNVVDEDEDSGDNGGVAASFANRLSDLILSLQDRDESPGPVIEEITSDSEEYTDASPVPVVEEAPSTPVIEQRDDVDASPVIEQQDEGDAVPASVEEACETRTTNCRRRPRLSFRFGFRRCPPREFSAGCCSVEEHPEETGGSSSAGPSAIPKVEDSDSDVDPDTFASPIDPETDAFTDAFTDAATDAATVAAASTHRHSVTALQEPVLPNGIPNVDPTALPTSRPPSYTSARPPAPDTLEWPICQVCFGELQRRVLLPCHHNVCVACVRSYIKHAIRSHTVPINCPSCGIYGREPIPEFILRRLIAPSDWKLYTNTSVMKALRSERGLVVCPTPDCCNIFVADGSVRWVKCGVCLKEWCRKCSSNDPTHKHAKPVCFMLKLEQSARARRAQRKGEKGKGELTIPDGDGGPLSEVVIQRQYGRLMNEDRTYARCPKCKCRRVIGRPNGRYDWHYDQFWSPCWRKKYDNPNEPSRLRKWLRRWAEKRHFALWQLLRGRSFLETPPSPFPIMIQPHQARLMAFLAPPTTQVAAIGAPELTPDTVFYVLSGAAAIFGVCMIAYFVRMFIYWRQGSLIERQPMLFQRG
ncbi:hypothetical protein HDU96_001039 [Phlyctochytrium bullatum]|nr:hypothetical protein HDU96_001039 [Phlyctochytrium bullatum]